MNVALKNEVTPRVLGNLFNYYASSELNSKSSYEAYFNCAKQFLAQNEDSETVQEIRSSEFSFDEDCFIFMGNKPSLNDQYDFILGFENFCNVVKNIIEEYEPKFVDFKGLERKVLSLEGFQYVGFNEINITPSNSSYSLLFE